MNDILCDILVINLNTNSDYPLLLICIIFYFILLANLLFNYVT
jgi:hypothetical protein